MRDESESEWINKSIIRHNVRLGNSVEQLMTDEQCEVVILSHRQLQWR